MLYYCSSCSRVFVEKENCPYCNEGNAIELKKNAPVNVIGTKLKGRIFKGLNEKALVVIKAEDKSKVMKEYPIKNLRKIL